MADQRPMTASEFASVLDVSRETLERLKIYEDMLRRWQGAINLVSNRSLEDVWRRHFLDSGQLHKLIDSTEAVVDIGSGAGFPGLVIAILSGAYVTLIESDSRKAAFLREVSREVAAETAIVAERAEIASPTLSRVVTARAVAPLHKLLPLAERWIQPGGQCLFLKGDTVEDELTDASRVWDINYDLVPSLSDSAGVILRVKEFSRV